MHSADSDHVPYDIYSKKAAELIELSFLPRLFGGGVYLETKLTQNLLFASNTVPRARYYLVISNCLYHIWDGSPKAELQLA